MNDLGKMLLASAAQATLLASFAAVVYVVVGRRRPGAAAEVAVAALVGCVVVTIASLCPLPGWWTWQIALPTRNAATSVAAEAISAEGKPAPDSAAPDGNSHLPALVWRSSWLGRIGERLQRPSPTAAAPGATTLTIAIFLTGLVLGVSRLLLGLWAVDRYRRSSDPIEDTNLHLLMDEIRGALGCRRGVALRECPDLGGPATAGWLRPVLLLPASWREWNEPELRAVVAHELAHIHRADFAARVFAGLSVALHLYHPLIHWLSARLCLQQELAADALAAPLAGGQASYLRSLARLALRLDAADAAWPARSFLSSPRTLMRRIQMLRIKDDRTVSPAPLRTATAVIVAGVVAVSALRTPAGQADPPPAALPAAAESAAPSPRQATTEGGKLCLTGVGTAPTPNEPFDLVYCPPDAHGIVMCRPAALLGRPGCENIAKRVTKEIHDFAAIVGCASHINLDIADIDLVVATVDLQKPEERPNGKATLLLSLRALRAVKDFDWLQQMKALAPTLQEVHDGNRTYYRCPEGAFPAAGLKELNFVLPDRRTILFHTDLPPARPSVPAWLAHWKEVERQDAALAIDCRDWGWLQDYAKKKGDLDPAIAAAIVGAETLTFGLSSPQEVRFTGIAGCPTKSAADSLRSDASHRLDQLAREANTASQTATPPSLEGKVATSVLLQMATHSRWSPVAPDHSFRWDCKLEMSLPDLLGMLPVAKP